ncbi:LysR family transcriptional regulator [Stigmatella sp. ncwal1]|uniref:LysR family transcriptional regulator n=1 Tax=Stigmatella ashevillensis TaxID=2995309 RepID=A0ABT5D9T2_9BACT|nr:LysR family transcriptional regulator [Stigmatella ashevillena]MDC0709809.1 LysR family transcriptional regulator [Stigmatella ashevillena]
MAPAIDSLLDVTVFTRVATAGSLSAAARELGMSLAVVSKRLARLEDRLGLRLVNRTTRSLSLTEEGSEFYERCVHLLGELGDAEEKARARQQGASGLLKVTSTAAFARRQLGPLIPHFLERYPGIRVQLDVSDTVADLVKAGYDVAIRFGALPSSSLIAKRLAPNHRVVCGAPAYFAKRGRPEHPADLKHHGCIAFGDPPNPEWQFEGADGATVTVRVEGPLTTNNGDVAHEWALEGGGLVLKSIWDVGPDIEAGRLEVALSHYRVPAAPLHAIYPHTRGVAAKVKVFVEFLGEELRAAYRWGGGGRIKAEAAD